RSVRNWFQIGSAMRALLASAAACFDYFVKSEARSRGRDKRILQRSGGGRELLLAPEAELLVDDAVGEAEQYRLLLRLVDVFRPTRHDEDVARAPFQHLVADDRFAAAFGAHEDGAVGRAVSLRFDALGQELK